MDGAVYGYKRTHLSEVGLAKEMYAKEGYRSFYKGFAPCLMRSVPLAFI
jgi:hypothetical protein